ncbi:MAG TPA: DUF302 domain-containing protein [Novimethylophilus sp.]
MRTWMVLGMMAAIAAHAEPMPPVDPDTPIYQVRVEPGVSYEDVVTSLKVAAEGKNFVSPATFPLAEHLKLRGLPMEGALEVRSYCNLGLGAEILRDHPEFAVFAPCRIAIYQKQGLLYLALDRPTYDFKYIKNPTDRARKAARQLEETLIWMMDMARKGEI